MSITNDTIDADDMVNHLHCYPSVSSRDGFPQRAGQ
jgi:hypothetical protein